jgi:hypothetical protein
LFKGHNIQELSVGDTSVGDTSTLHQKNCPQILQSQIKITQNTDQEN